MKRIFLIMALSIFIVKCFAQQFQKADSIDLPLFITKAKVEWIDIDNDSLVDVLVIGTDASGKKSFLTYKSNLSQKLIYKTSVSTNFDVMTYGLYDIDLDNRIDIVVSGQENNQPITTAFINNGDFTFTKMATPIAALSGQFRMADLDQDASNELLISGNSGSKNFTKIFKNKNGNWQVVRDSLKVFRYWTDASLTERKDSVTMNIQSVEIFDFDGDSYDDLFVSAIYKGDSVFNGVLYNKSKYVFARTQSVAKLTNASIVLGDLNTDGAMDVILSGQNSNGVSSTVILNNTGSSFTTQNFPILAKRAGLFIADLNSDGLPEVLFTNMSAGSDTLKLILNTDNSYDTLNSQSIESQKFGDVDRDGDLDLIQLEKTTGFRLLLFKNTTTSKNGPPLQPSNTFALNIYGRLLVYWQQSSDDHTPVSSISYDLSLYSQNADLMHGNFDDMYQSRLLVSYGNQSLNNFNLFKKLPGTDFRYFVQAVDNSFYANKSSSISNGGGGGGGQICNGPTVKKIKVCKDEKVTLPSSGDMVWFSFVSGFQKGGTTFDIKKAATDTLISFPRHSATCDAVNVYLIDVKTDPDVVTKTRYVCADSVIELSTETTWPKVEWSSTVEGFISTTYSIKYPFTISNDTVKVKITTSAGCTIQRNTILKLSKLAMNVISPIQIVRGQTIQLHASGALSYSWSPSNSLDNPNIPDPKASPTVDTNYIVYGTDSIGCVSYEEVLVIVEAAAFIPNLFTPNGDGKNDNLHIFGLDNVKSFSFSIHNREGNTVYQTSDVGEVTNRGWDGTLNGIAQPAAVYFWQVRGETNSGWKILLGGKSQGSIVLIR